MALPVTIPNTFANATASIPLANLDANFTTIYNAVNGIGNGSESLANVTIAGGTIANVTISSGNATFTTANATTVDTTNIEVTNIKAKDGTASATIADSTGVFTLSTALAVTSGGTGATTSTGSGAVVLATSPTLVTPVLGVATATSVNKVAVTAPATSATLTIADGKTLTASNSLTLAGTDATTMTFPATSTTVAGLGIVQAFSVSQRGTVTTDNDGSFDMNATNNFLCTPTGAFTLTFTNITAGQSGNIILVNGSNYTVSAAAATKVAATTLAAISATGTYWLAYFSPDGTNVYVANTAALA